MPQTKSKYAAILLAAAGFCSQAALADGEYFDAQNPPTREELRRLLKLPDAGSGQGMTRSIGQPRPAYGKTSSFFLINIPFGKNTSRLNGEARQMLDLLGDAMANLPGQDSPSRATPTARATAATI